MELLICQINVLTTFRIVDFFHIIIPLGNRGRYPALGHLVFFKWEENKYFSPYACWFIFKSDLINPNFVEKNSYLYCFSWKFTFSMSKVNFWIFGFIETKRLNIDSFTNENWNKFECHRSVVSRRKEKSSLLITYYK